MEGGDADLLELLGGWPLAKEGFWFLPNFVYTDFVLGGAAVVLGVNSVYLSMATPLCLLLAPGTLGGGRGGGVGWNVLPSIGGLCCLGISS